MKVPSAQVGQESRFVGVGRSPGLLEVEVLQFLCIAALVENQRERF